jgi:hypothetical protein
MEVVPQDYALDRINHRMNNVSRRAIRFLTVGILFLAVLAFAQQRPVAITHVRSGHAELLQRGRLTILKLSPPKGPIQRIALTHPSDYFQGSNAPFEARLIAESPHRFLIFTDTFASNPGDIQGKCGASESGERFVHIVALGAIPHETLSTLVDSCLLDLEANSTSPRWRPKPDSAGSVGQLILSFEPGTQPTTVYYVASDGSVSRPEIKPTSAKTSQ